MRSVIFSSLAIGALLLASCSGEDSLVGNSPDPSDSAEELSPTQVQTLMAADEATWENDAPLARSNDLATGTKDEEDDGDDEDDHHYGVPRTTRSYEITLENLTPATGPGASQPISPPVFASHNRSLRMFRVGRKASSELAQIAQDAQNGPMLSLLEGSSSVHQSGQGTGVVLPGMSDSYMVETVKGARRLSMAFMLVNTNDAFAGVDAIRLPRHGTVEIDLYAYDAGSEANSELASEIPGPCCGSPGMGTATQERISHHEGIRGDADLDADTYGWDGPVARLTIRRLEPAYSLVVENLTPATGPGSSQVFSPPVLATHGHGIRMFERGHSASFGLAQIAQDAINGPMLSRFQASERAYDVQEGGGVIPPGASAEYFVESAPGFRRLSMAFMLVNTNDGFSGVDSLYLPRGGQARYKFRAYDAGSEKNTELATDIPGPCCGSPGMGTPTHDRIRPHRGIRGVGDLDPDLYDWDGAAMRIVITRVR